MDFRDALQEARQDVRTEAAARRVKTTTNPENWINYFPELLQEYSFCYLTITSSRGITGSEEAEQALEEQIRQSDEAWDTLSNKARRKDKEMEFTPWEMMSIAATDRTDPPNCMRAEWKNITDAQEDYHNFFITDSGKPCYEGRKEFETLYKASDFINGLAKALHKQGC